MPVRVKGAISGLFPGAVATEMTEQRISHDDFFFIYFYYLEANYFKILQWFLPYIDMNQPWIYMCSPS